MADKESEIELLKQMIRSLKTEINVKLIDISRMGKKVKRLDRANDMRHDFIQTHFKKTFKIRNNKDSINKSMQQEKETKGVVLPPLKPRESKVNGISSRGSKTPLKQLKNN